MSELTNLQERKKALDELLARYESYIHHRQLYPRIDITGFNHEDRSRMIHKELFTLTQTARDHLDVGIGYSIDEMRIELQLINEKLEAIETLLAS